MGLLTKEKVNEICHSDKPLSVKHKAFLAETIAYYSKDPYNRRATAEGSCLYRTEDGKACAIGRWIPDEVYNPVMERGEGADTIVEDYLKREDKSNALLALDTDVLQSVQNLHDRIGAWDEEKGGLTSEGVMLVKRVLHSIKIAGEG